MKPKLNKVAKWVAAVTIIALGVLFSTSKNVMADGYGLTVSPMDQKLLINPGETQEASFKISNPSSSTQDLYYSIEVEPFYNNEKGEVIFESEGDMGEIANWIHFTVPTTGKLAPNEITEITFAINAPTNAPAGGQYASILVKASPEPTKNESNSTASDNNPQTTINEVKRMGHLIYAEVTGNTIKQGQISDASLPGLLLSGKITGSAIVKNTGNVHGEAKYTLQVFPLGSNEEIYSNAENPATYTILPNRSQSAEVVWNETPAIGIFNAKFTVEFEGEMEQISKLIIICPIWLLFLVIFAIIALTIWIVMRAKDRNKSTQNN